MIELIDFAIQVLFFAIIFNLLYGFAKFFIYNSLTEGLEAEEEGLPKNLHIEKAANTYLLFENNNTFKAQSNTISDLADRINTLYPSNTKIRIFLEDLDQKERSGLLLCLEQLCSTVKTNIKTKD